MTDAGIALIKHYEGFRGEAYVDLVGVPTIGFGFTEGVKFGDRITLADAEKRLRAEIAPREAAVLGACRGHTPLENQLAAMTSLAYNIGLENFRGSSVLRLHNRGDTQGAGDAFRLWCKARVGDKLVVVPGLVRRRNSERALYLEEA